MATLSKILGTTFVGAQGPAGLDGEDGRGIVSVVRTAGTGAPGTTDTYTITYTDTTTSTFQVYNGGGGSSGFEQTFLLMGA